MINRVNCNQFPHQFSIRIKNSFEKLSEDLQKKLSGAKEFVKASVSELMQVPQDLLSSLRVSHINSNLSYDVSHI